MTLPTIAVHLDHTERCEVRTLLAARLARRHSSHLVGIDTHGGDPRVSGDVPDWNASKINLPLSCCGFHSSGVPSDAP